MRSKELDKAVVCTFISLVSKTLSNICLFYPQFVSQILDCIQVCRVTSKVSKKLFAKNYSLPKKSAENRLKIFSHSNVKVILNINCQGNLSRDLKR